MTRLALAAAYLMAAIWLNVSTYRAAQRDCARGCQPPLSMVSTDACNWYCYGR